MTSIKTLKTKTEIRFYNIIDKKNEKCLNIIRIISKICELSEIYNQYNLN